MKINDSFISSGLILRRMNILIILIVLTAVLVISVFVNYSREQQHLSNKVSNFHDPSIYYAAKLIESFQEMKFSFYVYQQQKDLNKENAFSNAIINPLYSIKDNIKAINELGFRQFDQN